MIICRFYVRLHSISIMFVGGIIYNYRLYIYIYIYIYIIPNEICTIQNIYIRLHYYLF